MTEYVVVSLLFLAVLAFAWFYLQRAKARDAAVATPSAKPEPADPTPADSTHLEP